MAAGEAGFRWATGQAMLRLTVPPGATELHIRAASGRPDGGQVALMVTLDDRDAGTILIDAEGGAYVLSLALPVRSPGARGVVVGLRSATFTPRDYDRASPDGRTLGVRIAEVEIAAP
jgi:hypothetical protein